MAELPEDLETIRRFVNGAPEDIFGETLGSQLIRDTFSQYGFQEKEMDFVYINQFGDNFEDLLDSLSLTLLGDLELEEYLRSSSFTRVSFLINEYIPNNPEESIQDIFIGAGVTGRDLQFLDKLLTLPEASLRALRAVDSRIETIYSEYRKIQGRGINEFLESSKGDPSAENFESMMDSFTNEKGDFTWAGSAAFKDTSIKLGDYFRENERSNNPPPPTLPWEMRVGVSKFAVPPISVNVYQSFQSGSLSGGALRQMNTPKFNSGHSETLIDITLYFPNQESVWGFEGESLVIDVLDPDTSDEVLDKYLSSLRGLVTQFKYAPFLPIRNQYLNQVYDITAVALKSMSVTTLEGFPFTLAVNLTMQKFNHKVFLPTIRDFNEAIHWGRFRQYMIAAAQRMERVVNKGFLVEKSRGTKTAEGPMTANQAENFKGAVKVERSIEWERPETVEFNKKFDFDEGKHLEIYFPQRTPARVFFPEYSMFRAEGENASNVSRQGAWGEFLAELGYSPTDRNVAYDALDDQNLFEDRTDIPEGDKNLLSKFLTNQEPSPETWQAWKDYYKQNSSDIRDKNGEELDANAADAWFAKMYNEFLDRDAAAQRNEDRANIAGQILLKEWAIPMTKTEMDWDKVFITGVSTTIGNNFARLQLQMEEDPVLQHIGGMDSQINVNMVVFGESELIKWKRMFTHVNGLAMLEHAHGVMGFLGIKNIITSLCGIKYVLPLDFNVETIPGYPRVYNVTMSFVDFDVEQQKREELSNQQQRELTSQFSKKNPFLRLKQLWGCVDADTEIMTKRGWLKHDELRKGDIVLTLNEHGSNQWQECEAVNRYDVDTQLLSLESKVHSSLTSFNHRWPVLHKSRKDGIELSREWRTSEELNSNDYLILGALSVDAPRQVEYSDAFVELVAWIWTEGNIRKDRKNSRIRIYQSHKINQLYVNRIRDALKFEFGEPSLGKIDKSLKVAQWREIVNDNGMTMFSLNTFASLDFLESAIDSDRVVSRDFLDRLTLSQLQLFLRTSLEADGHYRNETGHICQSEKARLEPIEYAAILAGFSTYVKEVKFSYRGEPRSRWDLSLRHTHTYNVPSKGKQKWVPYEGVIWCPTTANATWLARRGGKAFYTGNSFNAYPDFPLSITDEEGNIVGHLDPDYYFRAFDTWDSDILRTQSGTPPAAYYDDIQAEMDDLDNTISALGSFSSSVSVAYDQQREELAKKRSVARYFVILDQIKALEGEKITASVKEQGLESLRNERDAIIKKLGNNVPVENTGPTAISSLKVPGEVTDAYADAHKVRWSFGVYGEEQEDINIVEIKGQKINLGALNKKTKSYSVIQDGIEVIDDNPDRFMNHSFTEGLTPLSDYQKAYVDGVTGPVGQYEQMVYDTRYRDVSGRMIRAFPTYMLWLIDEGGRFAGYKLFDNFYGLQSVIDFSVVQSEDILGDTLIIRLSNLYKKLTTPTQDHYIFGEQGAEDKTSYSAIDTILRDVPRNINSGTRDNYLVDLNNVRLRPGVRLHLRVGYGSNPNALNTVFNGVITQVIAGDVVEVVAQSDAIELSAIVNTTNEKGSSGDIDGAMFTGAWLSEPRDLMIRLLTMGTSQTREWIANAHHGMIFSENKWGIRHFGSILYEPMGEDETQRYEKYAQGISDVEADIGTEMDTGALPSADATTPAGVGAQAIKSLAMVGGEAAIRTGVLALVSGIYSGLEKKRDYEIFKRNIYPGNGTGIAQYLGADALNGGDIVAAMEDTNVNAYGSTAEAGAEEEGVNREVETVEVGGANVDLVPAETLARERTLTESFAFSELHGYEMAGGIPVDKLLAYNKTTRENHPILKALGVTGSDEDVGGHDEVSFRASTYMKSVWDLFQTCAALLPNYIVAVRPFEDRSTVFYGKPHWLYTSGVIPLSLGVPNDGSEGPQEIQPDSEFAEILSKLGDLANATADSKDTLDVLNAGALAQTQLTSGTTGGGYAGGGGSPTMVVEHKGKQYTLSFPYVDQAAGKNLMAVEMHLGTTGPHMQRADLPEGHKYPFYIDKADPGDKIRGGYAKIHKVGEAETVLGERAAWADRGGAFDLLPPDVEQYYMNMRWDYNRTDIPQAAYKYRRVLVTNLETNLSCVCAVGEWGPHGDTGLVAGASPDTHMALGNIKMKHGIPCTYGWLPDDAPLGPSSGSSAAEVGTRMDTGIAGLDNAVNLVTDFKGKLSGAIVDAKMHQAELTGDAYKHFSKGWHDTKYDPWNHPWQGKMGGHSIEDWIDKNSTDIYTDAVLETLEEARKKSNVKKYYEEKLQVEDLPGWAVSEIDLQDTPFGPDPVSIAARRYYDNEYNERLSYLESELVEAGHAGFQNNFETYSISNTQNFTGEGGTTLKSGRGKNAAKVIWKNFRELWIPTGMAKEIIDDLEKVTKAGKDAYMPELERKELIEIFENYRTPGIPGPNGELVRPPEDLFPDPMLFVIDKSKEEAFTTEDSEGKKLVANKEEFRKNYNKSISFALKTVEEFVQFLWQHPYARAWVVMTAEGDDGIDITGSDHNNYKFNESAVTPAFSYYLSIRDPNNPITYVPQGPNDGPNPTQLKLLGFLQQNNVKGGDVGGINDLVSGLASGIGESIGKLWKAVSIGFSGLFGLFEAALGNYGEGLERVLAMQRRTNILNAAYNDSIYYAAGEPGSLSRMVDNPFTREYGEPVVEVREPFQRLHYVNSFQHIISNQISENLDNVYTTITTTSDGNYPITVFFDRGSPPERQVEGFVESGIYWDNAKGSGFFGFLHPALNIVESARGISKIASGSSDEMSAKRIGIYHLKESLKDIYMGEIIILGNADIRPWDLLYIGDISERMYGIVEVEQVVHHFTPETGFITSITPNALAVANDPSRWSALSWVSSWMGVKNVRDDVRNMMITRASDSSPLARGEMTVNDLIASLQPQLKGQTQYTHGSSAMMKDFAGHFASGLAYADGIQGDKSATEVNVGGTVAAVASSIPVVGMFADLAWDAWKWTRDTLADQQDCYILYLTKDGQPMDAGLSYNSGVAVGSFHNYTLLPGILGFEFDAAKDGNTRITLEDLLGKLGYNELDVLSIRRNTSIWISRLNARVLQVAGTGPDDDYAFSAGFNVLTGTVERVTDGDTVRVKTSEGVKKVRFSGIDTGEIPVYGGPAYDALPDDHVGKRARTYMETILYPGRPVAIRYSKVQDIQTADREAGVIFHNVPIGLDPSEHMDYLERFASAEPTIPWDSYLDDGRPHTANWEMIMAGYSPVNYPVFASSYNEPDRGANGINPVEGGG